MVFISNIIIFSDSYMMAKQRCAARKLINGRVVEIKSEVLVIENSCDTIAPAKLIHPKNCFLVNITFSKNNPMTQNV